MANDKCIIETTPADGVDTGVTRYDIPYSRANILARLTAGESDPIESIVQVDASDTSDPSGLLNAIASYVDYPLGGESYPLIEAGQPLVKTVNGRRVAHSVSVPGNTYGFDLPLSLFDGRDGLTIVGTFKPGGSGALFSVVDGATPLLEIGQNSGKMRAIARHSASTDTPIVTPTPFDAPAQWMGVVMRVSWILGYADCQWVRPWEASAADQVVPTTGYDSWGGKRGTPSSMDAAEFASYLGRYGGASQQWIGWADDFEIHDGIADATTVAGMIEMIKARCLNLGAI